MTNLNRLFLGCVAWLFVAQSNAIAEEATVNCTRKKLLEVAAEHVAIRFPRSVEMTKTLPPIVRDKGRAWEVTYQLPPNVAGGTPEVMIDKDTCEVISSIHGQ